MQDPLAFCSSGRAADVDENSASEKLWDKIRKSRRPRVPDGSEQYRVRLAEEVSGEGHKQGKAAIY